MIVLIETLWNVKVDELQISGETARVLIETLWNVKYCCIALIIVSVPVLIETLWNVKIGMSRQVGDGVNGINRNIVECKVHKQHFTVYFCIVIIVTVQGLAGLEKTDGVD